MPELPLHSDRVESALREMRAVGMTEVVKSELGQTGTIELGGVRRFVEPARRDVARGASHVRRLVRVTVPSGTVTGGRRIDGPNGAGSGASYCPFRAAESAASVAGPTTPSCLRPEDCWNSRTACAVAGPNFPSTLLAE